MKKLSSSGQTFSEIRKKELLYVDKTGFILNLINDGKCYFLSRPRHFGKSLLLDAMNEIFCGRRKLFKDLAIDASGYDFKKYPVLLLSMPGSCDTKEDLKTFIISKLKVAAKKNGLTLDGTIPDVVLTDLVTTLTEQTGEKVVILIDEYDAPILAQIDNVPQALENRKVLHAFYSALKTLSDTNYIHFMFVTGVPKFSKSSIFSVFNHLKDLTLNPKYAAVCGFTISEFDAYFTEYLPEILEYNKSNELIETSTTLTEFRKMILDYYDGYSWDGKTRVLNPFSLINFLDIQKFKAFWYESATPTFLVDHLKNNPLEFSEVQEHSITDSMLAAVDIGQLNLVSLLFQTGYLTIDSTVGADEYFLRSPNHEVESSFNIHLAVALTDQDELIVRNLTEKIRKDFANEDADELAGGVNYPILAYSQAASGQGKSLSCRPGLEPQSPEFQGPVGSVGI